MHKLDEDQKRIPECPLTEAERAAIRAEHWSWLRYILMSALDGAAIGALVAIAIIKFDLHGIGSMLESSDYGTGYELLLIGSFAHTFAMVVCGSAIWIRATEKND